MTLKFPKHKDHIRGIKLGLTSQISPAIEKTEMELGSVKKRVLHKRPASFVSVTVLCSRIGKGMIESFWLNEAHQGNAWFMWPCIRGYENSKMRFDGDLAFTELSSFRDGLFELALRVEVRGLPPAPDADLIAEIDEYFGSVFNLYTAVDIAAELNLKSEFETMRSFSHGNH